MQVSSFVQHSNLQLAGILAVAFTDVSPCHRSGQDHASAQAVDYTLTFIQQKLVRRDSTYNAAW